MERSRWQLSHGDLPMLVPGEREVKGRAWGWAAPSRTAPSSGWLASDSSIQSRTASATRVSMIQSQGVCGPRGTSWGCRGSRGSRVLMGQGVYPDSVERPRLGRTVIQRTILTGYPVRQNIDGLPPEDACVPKTVLVIDDEDLIRDLMKDSLETLGIQVLLAEDLAGGIRLLRADKKEVDLVLLDGTPGGI